MKLRSNTTGSNKAEESESEQNLQIAFRWMIDIQGLGGVVFKVVQGITQVEIAHWGVAPGVKLAWEKLG